MVKSEPPGIKSLNTQVAFTQNVSKVGTTAAKFLGIPVGARATAMGTAFVSVADDATATYWNPGALDRMPNNQMIVQQTNWLVDTKIFYLGAGYKWNNIGTIGVSAHFFSSGEIEETTLLQPDGTGRTFSADDFALGLTFSRRITNRFSTGVTVKLIQESLAKEKASAVAVASGRWITSWNSRKTCSA